MMNEIYKSSDFYVVWRIRSYIKICGNLQILENSNDVIYVLKYLWLKLEYVLYSNKK